MDSSKALQIINLSILLNDMGETIRVSADFRRKNQGHGTHLSLFFYEGEKIVKSFDSLTDSPVSIIEFIKKHLC